MALFESDDIGEDISGPLAKVDLAALGSDFAVSIFVFEGAEDDIAPAQLAKAFLDGLTAPQKEFVAIEGAGHTAMYTNSAEFLRPLDENVRPFAADVGAPRSGAGQLR